MKSAKEAVDALISYKVSLGGAASTYNALQNYVKFASEFPLQDQLTEQTVYEWCKRRATESKNGYIRRLSAANELIKFCYAMGIVEYQFDTDLRPSRIIRRYEPYIFSDDELCDIFEAADNVPMNKRCPLRHLVIRVIFRLQYFCGLRPQEIRMLLIDDVNVQKGTIHVRENKARAERLIPMADDVNQMLKEYLTVRKEFYSNNPYLFPSPSGGHYSGVWLASTLKDLWCSSGQDRDRISVRPYDLRHRFATSTMMTLLDAGYDIDNIIPYLRIYMGHTQFQHTYYYIHLLPKRLLQSKNINLSRFEAFIPEIEPYEE